MQTILDSAQEALRFLDGYFPAYLTRAAARLQKGRPIAVAGGGLGLLSMLLLREGGFPVYAWEPRTAWRELARAWAAENGMADDVVFLPERLDDLPRAAHLQATLLEPPLVSLFDIGGWWHQARAILTWSGAPPLLPAAIAVRAAAGFSSGGRRFLDAEPLRALAEHYRGTLDVDLSPLVEAAARGLHPRLLQAAPPVEQIVSGWHAAALDVARWMAAPAQEIAIALPAATDTPIDRIFVTLGLLDPDGEPIESSLFESHQRLELLFPEARTLPRNATLTLRATLGLHGFEFFAVEGSAGRGAPSDALRTARLPEGAADWPARAPRFHVADHLAMLSDRPRLAAYQRALQQRLHGGERVLDLGAGTGLLGVAALRAGAAHVLAVERDSTILDVARAIFARSGAGEGITPLRALSHQVAPPAERADLLVSEILGDKVLNEGILEYMVDARDRYCKRRAAVIPRRLEVFMVGCESGQYVGHMMQGIREHLERDLKLGAGTYAQVGARLLTGDVARFQPDRDVPLTEPLSIGSFDLETLALSDIPFEHEAALRIVRDGTLNAFFVWFVAELAEGVVLTNSPWDAKTHWRQLRLHDFPPRGVRAAATVHARIAYHGDLIVELQ